MDVKKYLETLIVCGIINISDADSKYIRLKLNTMLEAGVDIGSWIKIFMGYEDFNFVFLITRLFSISNYAKNNTEYAKHMKLLLDIVTVYNQLIPDKKLVDEFLSSCIGKLHKANTYNFDIIHNTIESSRVVSVVKSIPINIANIDGEDSIKRITIDDSTLRITDKENKYSEPLSAILVNKGRVELVPKMSFDQRMSVIKDKIVEKGYDIGFVSFKDVMLLAKVQSLIIHKKLEDM